MSLPLFEEPAGDAREEYRRRLKSAAGLVRKDRWKRYEVLDLTGKWRRALGVTTAIGVLDKPALVKWSANVQFDADVATAYRLLMAGVPAGLSADDFRVMFQQEAGAEKEHQKRLREAADLGTAVHALVEYEVRVMLGEKPKAPDVPDEARYIFSGWEEWAKAAEFEPVAAEFQVYSRNHLPYAGTPDVLGWARPLVGGKRGERALLLIDWKTSNGLYYEHNIQNAAYRAALIEMGVLGAPVDGLLVRIPKRDGDTIEEHLVPAADDLSLMAVFNACLTIHPLKKAADEAGLAAWKAKKNAEREAAA